MEGLWQVLAGIKDTATLVLTLALFGLGYMHITMMRENRADRQALLEMLGKQVEAINGLKVMIAALTGRAQ